MSVSTPPQVLAIDLGTSAMKVALVGHDGAVTGWAQRAVDLQVLPGGGAEQRPEDWWTALGEAAADLGRAHPEAMRAVTTVCGSVQGEGTIPMGRDAKGELVPLHPCLLWMDMRGAAALRRQFGGVPHTRGIALRHLQRWIRLTGGAPSFTGKDPAAHMLWVRDERPEVYARTEVFLGVPDYINHRLTGRVAASVDSILTSWVTDNRDPRAIAYSDALVAASGVRRDQLPEVVACTDVLGPLTKGAAAHLGLREGVQVVAGAMDTTAAAIGAGTTGLGEPHLYLGTSSWIAAHVPRKKTDVLHGIASVPCAQPDRYLMTALQATAGGNLTWVRDKVLDHDDPLVAASDSGGFFPAIDEIVPRVPPGANGAMWMPWLWGERAPVDDLDLRAGMVNVSLETTRSDLIRAVLEGVAYNTRWMARPVDRFLGSPMRELAVAGGGAQSDAWCQVFADVLGVPVRRLTDPVQVNARGAAWIGAVGRGELSFADLPGLARVDRVFEPDPAAGAVYDAGFETYTALHKRLAPVYRKLAKAGQPLRVYQGRREGG